MTDDSRLDSRYFIDDKVFNCPFCNRRHVTYALSYPQAFDWTENKPCNIYLVKCNSCGHVSMHLSFKDLAYHTGSGYRFSSGTDLDAAIFYSVPTSFFALDNRIPRVLRELLTEAEGSLKGNYLTGASACARKVVYELSHLEGGTGDNYEERIKSLKALKPGVPAEYFDTLLTIQQVTSEKVHEESYDGWQAKHLRLILATLSEILNELYVVPALRAERRDAILKLKTEVVTSKQSRPKEDDSPTGSESGA